jgi:exodeoxyribonuclease V alpha subunit
MSGRRSRAKAASPEATGQGELPLAGASSVKEAKDPAEADTVAGTSALAEASAPLEASLLAETIAAEANAAVANAGDRGRGATPGHDLARQFAMRVAGWARERGAAQPAIDAARDAACAVSSATSSGHVCLRLDALAQPRAVSVEALREQLLASGMVGTADAPANLPLIVDDGNRLYLHRYFDYERRLARQLTKRAGAPMDAVGAGLHERLDALFAANAVALGERVDWQRMAVALAMLRKLTIVSGGPGTGKTTTVVNLIACLLADDPDCRIRLAAPTGKAAARMLDAIRLRAADLPAEASARFPSESFTLHRLLGATGEPGAFRHHAGNRLPLDVLVVDEASMLDLALATSLFEAVPDGAKVILLGDKDQLAAVEAGAVFAEICADPSLSEPVRAALAAATGTAVERIVPPVATQPTTLRDSSVWFTENFRFGAGSGIGRLATLINAGRADETVEWLRSGADGSVRWLEDGDRAPGAATLAVAQVGYVPYLEALRSAAEPAAVFDAFDRFRVLCAEREGPRGIAGMNEALDRWFRRELDHPLDPGPRSPWFPGRPVMIQRNDYVLKLYNGDVGVVLPDPQGRLFVCFRESDGSIRSVAPGRLPEHETAFATTVHKAQGSEFEQVLLVLPLQGTRVTRELLYTGITRARQRVGIASTIEVLRQGASTRAMRDSGLRQRMQETT